MTDEALRAALEEINGSVSDEFNAAWEAGRTARGREQRATQALTDDSKALRREILRRIRSHFKTRTRQAWRRRHGWLVDVDLSPRIYAVWYDRRPPHMFPHADVFVTLHFEGGPSVQLQTKLHRPSCAEDIDRCGAMLRAAVDAMTAGGET